MQPMSLTDSCGQKVKFLSSFKFVININEFINQKKKAPTESENVRFELMQHKFVQQRHNW